MSAPASIARANGAKSLGPVSAEGKAASARNSLKHGLSAKTVVLPHESQEDFQQLAASYLDTYNPATPAQCDLVREMVNARWRLQRIQEMESAVIQKAIHQQMELLGASTTAAEARAAAYAEVPESRAFKMIGRYSAQIRRAYEKARKELLELQAAAESQQELASLQTSPADPQAERQNEPNPRPLQHEAMAFPDAIHASTRSNPLQESTQRPYV